MQDATIITCANNRTITHFFRSVFFMNIFLESLQFQFRHIGFYCFHYFILSQAGNFYCFADEVHFFRSFYFTQLTGKFTVKMSIKTFVFCKSCRYTCFFFKLLYQVK